MASTTHGCVILIGGVLRMGVRNRPPHCWSGRFLPNEGSSDQAFEASMVSSKVRRPVTGA